MTAFLARFPTLFHVTDRTALPGIARHGLLSAARLCEVLGAAGDLGANRSAWRSLDTPAGRATLRRQGMGDAALRSRLDPAITLEAWRHFINGQVFLCATLADAVRLLRAEPTRAQTIIVFATAELLKASCELRFCTFNNGYIDRSPPHRRRLRHYDDYQPVAAWTPGTNIREIAIAGGIPATVGFEVTMLPD